MLKTESQQQRLEILKQIDEVYQVCKGCEHQLSKSTNKYCREECFVGSELQSLGEELLNLSGNQETELILAKGDQMTKSEVAYLISSGVLKTDIQKAIGISNRDFNEILTEWGLLAPAKTRGSRKMVTA